MVYQMGGKNLTLTYPTSFENLKNDECYLQAGHQYILPGCNKVLWRDVIFAKGKDCRWAQWSRAANPFQSFKKWVTTLLGRGALKRCFTEKFVKAQCFFQELEEYYIPKIVYISDFSTRAMIISPWYSLMTQFLTHTWKLMDEWFIHLMKIRMLFGWSH